MKIEEFNNEFLRFKDTAYRYAVALLHDPIEAEDATQDLYEKLWRRRLLIRRSGFRSLILTSIRNICLDVLRHRSRERERLAAESDPPPFEEPPSAEDARADLAKQARQLIDLLPDREREAMHLRDCEGLEFSEIASLTNSSEAAVRMAVSRAREKIKQQLLNIINNGQ